ncbi:Ras-specific guanine nucleotide-releasing factor RalGPS2 [Schistosoma japonicum]|nr:Ras-specific guanine nucleotide-releasing factor RalGPS2 [Schistosoma japonicum]
MRASKLRRLPSVSSIRESSLDSIFSQPTVSNQKGITNISNDKSNRSKSSTVPNVIRIAPTDHFN